MRGKGRLWRWGPNHSVRVIISRWKVKANGGPSDYMKVEGKFVLEFIVVQREDTGEATLPYVSFKVHLFGLFDLLEIGSR